MSHLLIAIKVSGEIHTLNAELEDIPVKVREVEVEVEALQEQYQSKKTEKETLEKEKRQLQTEFEDETTRLAEKEKRLNAIKTQKEYQAVTREITMAKTSNREREDRIIQLDLDLETFAEALSPMEEKLSALRTQLDQEKASIQGTLGDLESKIKSLETELSSQLKALPDDIRGKYQRIGETVQPPAASATGGTCHGCFLHLQPQLFIEIQKDNQVHSCPNCHRLLYLENEDA